MSVKVAATYTASMGIAFLVLVAPATLAFDDGQRNEPDDSTKTVREESIDDLLAKYGGSAESQRAVESALAWLAEHQLPDGSWSFDHREACEKADGMEESCRNPGSLTEARIAATGLALLPFLAARQTYEQGEHRLVVAKGLRYLVKRMKRDGSLRETGGSMYSHGIATLALCEAYALSKDERLAAPAAAALKHIEFAQDPVGGGWRYTPRTPGDTSVTGWQFSALRIGKTAGLPVSGPALEKTAEFLDSVQSDNGARYGYIRPGAGAATTAIGLLSRTYLGGKRKDEALARGVDFLAGSGPSKTNMYYNFYAGQVVFHYGGAEWEMWNEEMRDQLISFQVQDGHEKGSWYFTGDPGASAGGRHYATCMAALNLEVYYRHPRVFQE